MLDADARAFIEAKLAEQHARHSRTGASRYLVEPNIKEGTGGLRDLHTLHWLAKHIYPDQAEEEFVEAGVFTSGEYASFRRCEFFLWTVRCHLHFLTDREEDRLSFDLQRAMADRLGYRAHAGLSGVERFMKHYFMIALEVGQLTRIVCSALELKQLKSVPSLDTLLAPFDWRRRAKLRRTSDFRIENGRHFDGRQGCVQDRPGQLHSAVRRGGRKPGGAVALGAAPGPRELPSHRRRSAPGSDCQ